MGYFNEFPNIEYVNRFPNAKSNDEITTAKNIFIRPKIREDILPAFVQFDYYNIEDGERPDQIAEKLYGNPELDWIIRITNNIVNLNEDWPLSAAQLPQYLIKKYGSEEKLSEVRYYETIELKDSYNRTVIPGGLIVDKAFYDAPEFETPSSVPPGITFPPIYLDPIVGVASVGLSTFNGFEDTIGIITVTNQGRGYVGNVNITIGDPNLSSDASATVGIQSFRISGVTGVNVGAGYVTVPTVTISPPITSVQGIATCGLGTGLEASLVKTIFLNEQGIGYGLTAPSVVFDLPTNFITGASYKNESLIAVGNDLDGMYVRSDGVKIYTSSGTGSPLLREFTLSTPWQVVTLTNTSSLDISAIFGYCSGIEFSPDGARMYVVGGKSGAFFVAQYNLNVAWDLTTASYVNQTPLIAPGGVRLKNNGTRLYILNGNSPDSIEEYQLTVPWNLTSKVLLNTYNIETPTGDNQLLGFSFNQNATKMFATGVTNASVYEFNMDSPYDLSTLSYATATYVGDRIPNPSDLFIKPDITSIFIAGGSGNKVFQYDINVRALGYSTINEFGSITDITITNPGLGYTEAPNVNINAPFPAVQATAVANLSGGSVSGITITNTGFGYTSTPTVGITTAPYYRRAVGFASVRDGKIINVTVVDPGKNYYYAPTIIFTGDQLPTLNVDVGDLYSQADKTWRWNGTEWQEKITDEFEYLDGSILKTAKGAQIAQPVTNYEYEINLNESKRLLILPKPEYIPLIIKDFKTMMKYPTSSTRNNESSKSTYNPKLSGV